MKIWFENSRQGCPNRFSLEDIKGAAATILIAGNDTVCRTYTHEYLWAMSCVRKLPNYLQDRSHSHASCPLPDAEPRSTTQSPGGNRTYRWKAPTPELERYPKATVHQLGASRDLPD